MTDDGPEGDASASAVALDPKRYQIRNVVAREGKTTILAYKDLRVRRNVLIKRQEGPASKRTRARLLREARIQAQLEHPGVAPVYDIGVDDERNVYFTAQHVSGITLRRVLDDLRRDGPSVKKEWSRERLLRAFRQVCLTVHYAHERGVVHRNLKPEGIGLGDFGEVYLVDWSKAKILASGSSPLDVPAAHGTQTDDDERIGTVGYAAPEQLLDPSSVDPRADVYSLGAILFEILCQDQLHRGTVVEMLRSTHISVETRPSIRAPHRHVPRELDDACVKSCARDPASRYVTARELHDVIDAFLERDRDAAERRELAERHGNQAEENAVRAIVAAEAGLSQRRSALAEAGRALALDQDNSAARRAILALLREPPSEMPREAQKKVEEEEAELTRRPARFVAMAYLAVAAASVTIVPSGVRSWIGFSLIYIPLLTTSALWMYVARKGTPDSRLPVAICCLSSLGIAFSSGLLGALVLVPACVVLQTLGYNLGALRSRRGLVLSLGMLCVLLPYGLERLSVVPQSYAFQDGAFTILPVVQNFLSIPVRVGLGTFSVVTVVLLTVFAWDAHDDLSTLRERLYLNMWQIAQLLPAGARLSLPVASSIAPRGAKPNRGRP